MQFHDDVLIPYTCLLELYHSQFSTYFRFSEVCILGFSHLDSNHVKFDFSDKRICLDAIDLSLGTFYSLHVANAHSATCEGKERD